MVNFIDFLCECFKAYGYELCWQSQGWEYMVLKHREYNDFWILSTEFDAIKRQSLVFDDYKEIVCSKYPSALKNTSFLYVKKQDTIELTKQDKSIIEIENNPYYFKKYVLAYTDLAFREFVNLFSTNDGELSLSKVLMKEGNFEKLKAEKSYGAYHLLYSIAHKLPFVVVDVMQKKFEPGIPTYIESENDVVESLKFYDERNDVESMLRILNNEIAADENQ